ERARREPLHLVGANFFSLSRRVYYPGNRWSCSGAILRPGCTRFPSVGLRGGDSPGYAGPRGASFSRSHAATDGGLVAGRGVVGGRRGGGDPSVSGPAAARAVSPPTGFLAGRGVAAAGHDRGGAAGVAAAGAGAGGRGAARAGRIWHCLAHGGGAGSFHGRIH